MTFSSLKKTKKTHLLLYVENILEIYVVCCRKNKNKEIQRESFVPFAAVTYCSPTPLSASQASTANGVKVKTFEEIMQEKRLRRQELEEQARGSPEAAPQKDLAQEKPKGKVPAGVSRTLGSSSPCPTATQAPPPNTAASTGKLPARKLISLRSKVAPVGTSETPAAVASLPANQSSSLQTDADGPSQAKRARTLPQSTAAGVPAAEKTLRENQEKVSSHVKGTAAPHFNSFNSYLFNFL